MFGWQDPTYMVTVSKDDVANYDPSFYYLAMPSGLLSWGTADDKSGLQVQFKSQSFVQIGPEGA